MTWEAVRVVGGWPDDLDLVTVVDSGGVSLAGLTPCAPWWKVGTLIKMRQRASSRPALVRPATPEEQTAYWLAQGPGGTP